MGDFLTRKIEEIGKKCINEDGMFMADEFKRLLDEELPPKELLCCIEIDETPKSSVLPLASKDANIDKKPLYDVPPFFVDHEAIADMAQKIVQKKAH